MPTDTTDRSAVRTALALVSALVLGAGGLLFGTALTIVAGVVLTLLGVELSAAVIIVVGLIFVQGVGCAGVALAYLRLRPTVGPVIRTVIVRVVEVAAVVLANLGLRSTGDQTVAEAFDDEGPVAEFEIEAAVPDLEEVAVVGAGYVLAIGAAMGGSILVSLLSSYLSVETGRNQAADLGVQNPEVLLILIPASVLIVGPGEELLFRGVVQGRLREVFGPVVGILVPSVGFAGVHWFALTGGSLVGNLLAVTVLVIPAVVFGASYEYTDNIVVPALVHGIYNLTLFSMLYYAVVVLEQDLDEAAVLAVGALV